MVSGHANSNAIKHLEESLEGNIDIDKNNYIGSILILLIFRLFMNDTVNNEDHRHDICHLRLVDEPRIVLVIKLERPLQLLFCRLCRK